MEDSIIINNAFGERIVISNRIIEIKGSGNKVHHTFFYGNCNIITTATEIKSYLDQNNFTDETGRFLTVDYIATGLRSFVK